MPTNDNHFALVIGIDDYPFYRSLKGAAADADEFEKWVRDAATGGGVPDGNCRRLVAAASPPMPLGPQIDDALEEIVTRAKTKAPPRRFYFFFAGHGLAQMDNQRTTTAFCTARWSEMRRGEALSSDCYLNYVVQSGAFEEVILFADCCRVRKVSTSGFCPTLVAINPNPAASRVRQFIAYATELTNAAYEVAVGGDQSPVRGHFSRALMNALKGAVARPEGGVRASDLQRYLYAEVPRIAHEHNQSQEPEIRPIYKPAEEPVFGSAVRSRVAPAQPNVVIQFGATTTGGVRLEGPDIDQFTYHSRSGAPWSLALEVGIYILRDENTGREINVRVRSLTEVQNVAF
jgi:hypothetical protein